MTPVVVLWAKYVVAAWKGLLFVTAVVSSPSIGAQAGEHGAPRATPAGSHGAAQPHATTATAHGAAPAAAHGDAHAAPAAAAPAGAHATAADPHVAGTVPASGAHAPAHGDSHAAAGSHGEGAAHGDEHHESNVLGEKVWGVPSGIWHAINFFVLFGAIFWFSRKGLLAAAKAKRDSTAKNIEDATALREEMRKKFEDYDTRMRNIDAQMTSLVSEARSDAETEKAKLVAEATALAARMREDAKQIADQEIARARRELQEEQIARAADLAEQILKANVTKEDQARLSEEFMSRVGGPGKEGRA